MTELWSALSDPHRRAILDLLRGGPRTVNEVAAELGVPQPSASKHLKVLRTHGLVVATADGHRRVYRLDASPLVALDSWLAPYRQTWNTHLDMLDRHLEKDS